jgi:hypothetical protein
MFTSRPNYYRQSDILNLISQEQVFSEYLGIYPDLNKRFKSPFRVDKDPGCRFTWYSGILYFVENTMFQNKLYWSCIDVVKYVKQCSYQQALEILSKKTYLGVGIKQANTSVFIPEIRFEKKDWPEPNLFMLSGSILESELVFNVKNYWIKGRKGWNRNSIHHPTKTLVIAYYFPDTDHVKLYFPNEEDFRWYSNCSTQDIFGWHKVKHYQSISDKLFITKSGKDRLMLDYHIGIPSIALQNEGCYIPEDKHLELDIMFNDITFFYDNDIPGILQSQKLSEKYNYKYKIIDVAPKDSFEMIESFGIENTQKLIL